MKQKKVLALVLALCLVFTLSVAAFAADFTDLSSSHWSYDEVSDVVSRGIFLGTSATTFEPEADMTRAMFVTVLSRLAAADVDDNAATAFADVPTGLYYTGAVAWGSTNNLVKGLSATSFGPNQAITREQMATLIVRYAEFAGVTLPETVEAVTFTDEASISDYAKAAVTACQKAGLLNGMEDGSFNPKGTATRAQVATLTSRLAKIDNAITYTVTFNTNGGSEVAAQKVKGGAVATKPATPTKDNATFAGWYADSALTQSYDFDTPVQANITVYAKWNEAGSTSGGGGGGGSTGTTVEADSVINSDGRTDVAISAQKSGSKYYVTLAPAISGGKVNYQFPVSAAIAASLATGDDNVAIFTQDGENYIANPAEGKPGYTAMALENGLVAEALDKVSEGIEKVALIQKNPALEMYKSDERIKQDGKTWVKTNIQTVEDWKGIVAVKGSLGFIVPDASEASSISFELKEVEEVKEDGTVVYGKTLLTYTITNKLSFTADAWMGQGAAPVEAAVDGVESTIVAGTDKNGQAVANMVVTGNVDIIQPLKDVKAIELMKSVLNENGSPRVSAETNQGKFTIASVDIGAMLEGLGIEETASLRIVQQNAALEMFKDDPSIKKEGSKWIKNKTYPAGAITAADGKYYFALDGSPVTISIYKEEAAKPALVLTITNSKLKFAADIKNLFEMQDFGCPNDGYAYYSAGWKYNYQQGIDLEALTKVEVVLKDANDKVIVTYTATNELEEGKEKTQLAYQREKGYMDDKGQTSTPFAKGLIVPANGYTLDENGKAVGNDWTIQLGEAWDTDWEKEGPGSCTVTVTTVYGSLSLTNNTLTGTPSVPVIPVA